MIYGQGETIIREELVEESSGTQNIRGYLTLTNQRLIFERTSGFMYRNRETVFTMNLSSISRVEARGVTGFRSLNIQGGTRYLQTYKFQTGKAKDWEADILQGIRGRL